MAGRGTFSIYASNFLNASFIPQRPSSRSSVSSQPLFYSVTEGSDVEQSDARRLRRQEEEEDDDDESDVDEEGEPWLREGNASNLFDADNPYLQDLDEEDLPDMNSPQDSLPLLPSASLLGSSSRVEEKQQGWLSLDLGNAPAPPPRLATSPPLSPSSARSHLMSPPTRTTLSESLLPRDGLERSVFHLPDPDRPLPMNKYNDSQWTAIWCGSLLACGLGAIIIFFTTTAPKSKDPSSPLPYVTLTHTIPLLILLTLLGSAVSYVHLLLLRFAVRPALLMTAASVPVALFVAAAWAFAGSFFWEEGVEPTWGETTGLRLFSFIPLACALYSARSLYHRQEALLRTVAIVELSTSLLISFSPVLLLSLSVLLGALIASIPFISLLLRLLLVGYFTHASDAQGRVEWHVRAYAAWLLVAVFVVWLWSWGVARGVLRTVVSGVVGNWYFEASPDVVPLKATRAAFSRAYGPSFGTICLGSLLLTITQTSTTVLHFIRRITTPAHLSPLSSMHPLSLLTGLISIFESFSSYAIVYVGVTGDPFTTSARRAKELVSNNNKGKSGNGRKRKRVGRTNDYALLAHLLTLSSLSLAAVSAIGGYIFAAHTLSGPANAPLAALLCGAVTYLTVRFGIGLAEDAADALFVCYRLDLDAGAKHREDVFDAFEGRRDSAGAV